MSFILDALSWEWRPLWAPRRLGIDRLEQNRTEMARAPRSLSRGRGSGDPDSNSVLLWIRSPRGESLSANLNVEVAEDELFKRVEASSV
jgi:phosphodiesterase/alkaline phosphatase D-like protein